MATRLGQASSPSRSQNLDEVELTHDGQTIRARRGEPLALSLIAADRLLLSRSPKLHRPRGPYCLRGACEGCLVRVDGLPNQPACRLRVRGGEVVETQNVLGTRQTDLLSATDFLFPQGIDHHRLMAGRRGLSALVSRVARRVAGLGRLAEVVPPPSPAQQLELPVLIVGGGQTGLAAAAQLGASATLVDDGFTLGGALLALEPRRAHELEGLALAAGAKLLRHASVLALSREPDDGTGRVTALIVAANTTIVARCRAVLLAPGCHDAVPAFANNELPGIFSARAALFAWRSDVLLGRRIAVVGAGRFADGLVQQLSGAVEVVRLDAETVLAAIGRDRISAVDVRTEGGKRRLKVDALAFDGPGAPSFELAVQCGASVDFDANSGYFPRTDLRGAVAERVFSAEHPRALASVREVSTR